MKRGRDEKGKGRECERQIMKRSVWSCLQQPREKKTEANHPQKIGPSTSSTFYPWPKYNLEAGKRFKFEKFPHLFILNSVTCAQPLFLELQGRLGQISLGALCLQGKRKVI